MKSRQQIKINYVFSSAVIAASLYFYSLIEQQQISFMCLAVGLCLFYSLSVWEIIGLVPEVASDLILWEEERLLPLWKMTLFNL